MKLLLPFLLVLLVGCSSDNVKPYFEVGAGYQIDSNTDWWVQTERKDQCSKQPQAHLEAGIETKNNWKVGYHHQSWLFCGEPFNNDPEIYQDDIRITKKFGGL